MVRLPVLQELTWGLIFQTFCNYSDNTHHRGKYYCMADLLFDCFGFDQTSKTVVHSTSAKQLNPNKINIRSVVQWYFPLSYCSLNYSSKSFIFFAAILWSALKCRWPSKAVSIMGSHLKTRPVVNVIKLFLEEIWKI